MQHKIRNIPYMDTPDERKPGKIHRLSNKQESRLSDDEYAVYLKHLRIKDDASKINNLSLKTRKRIFPVLRMLMKMGCILTGIKIYTLNTKMPNVPDGRPVIFVLTHVGKSDQIVFSNVVNTHFTVLSGDYESLHNNVEALVSMLNGILFFDMNSKQERHSVEERVCNVLQTGDAILCSMEAAWNLSPNKLVLELFPGMLRAALSANAVIIPVGIERFDSRLYGVNIAHTYFNPADYRKRYPTEKAAIDNARLDLRNIMADLKFQCYFHPEIEKRITIKREKLGRYSDYLKTFKDEILSEWTFTEDMINSKAYKERT